MKYLYSALAVVVVLVVGFVIANPEAFESPTGEILSITWRIESADEVDGMPQTSVTAVVNATEYAMGTFVGSCSEIGVSGGIDGTGLLAGELSAVQCWFAGGGNEVGVFAHEDGGFQIMVGELSEGEEGAGMFRGNFTIKVDVP